MFKNLVTFLNTDLFAEHIAIYKAIKYALDYNFTNDVYSNGMSISMSICNVCNSNLFYSKLRNSIALSNNIRLVWT